VRTYRLASVQTLEVDKAGFRRPRGFDLARYWQESSARFESGLRPLQAQVLVSPRALGWLVHARSRFVAMPTLPAGVEAPAGWQFVCLPLESIEHGARQIMGFGAQVEVIEPESLREEVVRLAKRVLEQHASQVSRPAAAGKTPQARARTGNRAATIRQR
jgi:predicted DNA-binding transcriptional regulator YafY